MITKIFFYEKNSLFLSLARWDLHIHSHYIFCHSLICICHSIRSVKIPWSFLVFLEYFIPFGFFFFRHDIHVEMVSCLMIFYAILDIFIFMLTHCYCCILFIISTWIWLMTNTKSRDGSPERDQDDWYKWSERDHIWKVYIKVLYSFI